MKQQVNIKMTLECDVAVDMGDLEENLKSAASFHGGRQDALVSVVSYDYQEEAEIFGNKCRNNDGPCEHADGVCRYCGGEESGS